MSLPRRIRGATACVNCMYVSTYVPRYITQVRMPEAASAAVMTGPKTMTAMTLMSAARALAIAGSPGGTASRSARASTATSAAARARRGRRGDM